MFWLYFRSVDAVSFLLLVVYGTVSVERTYLFLSHDSSYGCQCGIFYVGYEMNCGGGIQVSVPCSQLSQCLHRLTYQTSYEGRVRVVVGRRGLIASVFASINPCPRKVRRPTNSASIFERSSSTDDWETEVKQPNQIVPVLDSADS